MWPGEARGQLPGAPHWLRDCADASPPLAEMRKALEGRYRASGKSGPRHHFLVAIDHEAELCHNTVTLVADTAECLAPHAMILPREGWEGQQYSKTPAAPLVAQDVELGGLEFAYLDSSVEQGVRHWTAHHLLAPKMHITVDPVCLPTMEGNSP